MKRVRTRLGAALAAMTLGASAMVAMGGTAQALSNPAIPKLTFDHTITSHPFSGAPGNAIDIEGLGYVASDNSMWVADDNGDRVWEIDPTTGAYKSQLRGGTTTNPSNTAFLAATQVGSGLTCANFVDPLVVGDTGANECLSRTDDFESVIYDPTADVLYVTSGNCCTANLPAGYPYHPTVWKLTRDGSDHFVPTQWQALPDGEDPTAGGWRPGSGIYFGHSKKVQTYDFASNNLGTAKTISVTSDIVGLAFTDANTAFVTTATPNTASGRTTATSDSTVQRFDISGSTWTPNAAWKFPLASIGTPGGPVDDDGMIDARDLAIIGDTFYVSDGYDSRASNDHPIYVYTLGTAPAPTAAFSAVPNNGRVPLTVQFTDQSTPVSPAVGAPTSWAWNFGDPTSGVANTSTLQNPTHQYTKNGNYTVTLTASNATGPSLPVSHPVTVSALPPGPRWHFEALNGSGSGVSSDHFGGGNTMLQYGAQIDNFYADTTNGSLRHSWWDGAKWNTENLDGNGKNTNHTVGANVAATQFGNTLQLFYADTTTHSLRHAWYDQGWHAEPLDGSGGHPGHTNDNVGNGTISTRIYNGQIQVFYSDDDANTLRHAWWDGARWNFENLDTGLASSNAATAVTQYGSALHVLYNGSGGLLRHAWYDGAWHKETLDGGGTIAGHTNRNVGNYVKITQFGAQLDAVYQDMDNSALRHAWWNGAKWSYEALDGTGGTIAGHTNRNVGAYIAVLPYSGGLHIMYQDTTTGALRHAFYAGGWHVEVLDGVGSTVPFASTSTDTGRFTAMLQYGTQLQLTYFDHDNADRLQHSWWS